MYFLKFNNGGPRAPITTGTTKTFIINIIIITQADQPLFKFQLSFFFPRSLTNRRLDSTAHGSLMHAYDPWNLQKLLLCKATSSDAMKGGVGNYYLTFEL